MVLVSTMTSPFLSPTAQGVLRTIVELGRPSPVGELVSRCNPRPVTTSEAEVIQWRHREQGLHAAIIELRDAGMVTETVQKQGGRVVRMWLPATVGAR